MLDLLLRGAQVIDGSGAPGRVTDVGVRNGRITTTDPTDEPAVKSIDVTGLAVAPGFIDIHTHYDAQLFWDPSASPSPLHGVTTAIGGNCGFSLAPAGPDHAEYLMRMMARVEGMPLTALEQGLTWDWTSFGEWLTRLEGRVGVNAGFLCGHSAIRRAEMGDDAAGATAGPSQVAAMVRSLHDALSAGALGFSTSTAPTHNDGAGQPVPSRWASPDELLALARAVGAHPGTTLQLILAGCLSGFSDADVELMTSMSLEASRPVNWNVLSVSSREPHRHEHQLRASDKAALHGARVVALTLPFGTRARFSFLSGAVLDGFPGWRETMALPVPERLAALADRSVRSRLAAGAQSEEAGVLRTLADWASYELAQVFAPDNAGFEGRRVGEVAAELAQDPFDTLLDIVVRDRLRTALRPPVGGYATTDWELRTNVWRDPRTVLGGSDAGAHLDMMCGAVYTTALLSALRDNDGFSLEEAVHQLSDVPARLYGIRERGRIVPGWHADLVVFDPATVGPKEERTREDLPGGASRVYAESTGIHRVYVNGVLTVEDGVLQGATAGRLLRSGRDTDTVAPSP